MYPTTDATIARTGSLTLTTWQITETAAKKRAGSGHHQRHREINLPRELTRVTRQMKCNRRQRTFPINSILTAGTSISNVRILPRSIYSVGHGSFIASRCERGEKELSFANVIFVLVLFDCLRMPIHHGNVSRDPFKLRQFLAPAIMILKGLHCISSC